MPKQINLVFEGYYISKDSLPHDRGVYFVYRGIHNKITDKVELNELMYIGKADDIYDRHHPHDRHYYASQNHRSSNYCCGSIFYRYRGCCR